jgi:hypothetical protein
VTGRHWIAIVAFAVAVPGVLRDVSVYFWTAGPLATTRADDRFAGLSLPDERAGFFTDASGGAADRRYYEALYALAPWVLLPRTDLRLVVADVEHPASIERLCAERRLHVVKRASPGVALLERE